MKNQFIIPSIIIAAAILGGFWMLKPSNEQRAQKVIVIPPPDISFEDALSERNIKALKQHFQHETDMSKGFYGMNPVFFVVQNLPFLTSDSSEILDVLIQAGVNLNAQEFYPDFKNKITPLDLALYYLEPLKAQGFKKINDADSRDWKEEKKNLNDNLKSRIANIESVVELLRKHGAKTTAVELKAADN